jgi:hypothetical protein
MSDDPICADCGQGVNDRCPGREWGGPRWSHDSTVICVRALGEAVDTLKRDLAALSDDGSTTP